METKGVASVRSPVRNLQHFNTGVTHEGFVDAVIREFREEYPVALDSEVDKASFFFLLSPFSFHSFVPGRLSPSLVDVLNLIDLTL